MQERWFEQDGFWRDMEAKVYTPEQEAAAPLEAKAALELMGVAPDRSVLDLCCGNGRHSFALQGMGYRATGVDLSETYIARARGRAAMIPNPPSFILADVRTFRAPSSFNAALLLWNAFGYFENDDEDVDALRNAFESLAPGGLILIQTHGKESTARKFVRKDWFDLGSTIVFDERWIEDDWSRMRTRYVIMDNAGSSSEYVMSCRLYSPSDLRKLLSRAGFTAIKFFGSLDGRPYNERALELVVTAAKPAT